MNISAPFIRRPIATSLLAMAVLLAGLAAYVQLPVAPLPRVDFPTISVSANLPGASPEVMASAVATPLERRFGRIAGVTEITSTSSLGTTSITMQFDLGRDVDAAARDVQAAINAALGELPTGLPARPSYRRVNPADAPVLIVSLTSETIPLAQVFDVANSVLAQRISRVRGVGQVSVGGGQQPAVRVQVDPAMLAGLGLSLENVRTAISALTVDEAKGSLASGTQVRTLAANDQLFGAAAFRSAVIGERDGGAVRLGDIAHVIDDVENRNTAAWSDGRRAVLLIIRRQPGANIIETIERVKALLPSLRSSIPPAINVEIASDRAQTIRASVHDVELTLALSVVLVVFVVFVFLRNAWATIIPSVAVPLSLIATFGVMYLLDYSLDNLSLMALTISTGFVVDDAIVVTENVARFIEQGVPAIEAALKGARQVGFTIVSITVSLLAVFIPILLMAGVVGRLFREFAVTLSVAIAVSAIVSLTLTPMMCSRLLRPEDPASHGRLYRASERAFDVLVRAYDGGLQRALRWPGLMLLITAAAIGLSVFLAIRVPKGLFPQQDTGMIMGFSEAPQDISFSAMRQRQDQLNQIVGRDPDIAHAVSFIAGGNTGTMFLELRPRPGRRVSADEIIARLRRPLATVPGVNLFLQSVQDVRVGARPARTQFQYTLEDADLAELRTWAPKVLAALRALPELRDVNTDAQNAGLQLDVDIDRATAARLGITPQAIDDTLYDAFGQRQVATTFTQSNQYRVILEVAPQYQTSPVAMRDIYVQTPGGTPVPLRAITHSHVAATALAVNHQGQFPAVTLSFNVAPDVSLGQAIQAVDRAELAIGVPGGLHAEFQGTAQAFQSSLASEPMLVAIALLAVYIVLGMLYESLVHPITILSTLPSAGVGALLALIVFKTDFSIIALIGIILLIGIVKKNAIMMIDFALEAERDHGLSAREAIHRASLLRFRPILMTTMAALFGALPLAFGTGTGAELRRPLGVTIVGGLIFSQLLTLFTTPVIYLLLDRFSRRRDHRPGPVGNDPAPDPTP